METAMSTSQGATTSVGSSSVGDGLYQSAHQHLSDARPTHQNLDGGGNLQIVGDEDQTSDDDLKSPNEDLQSYVDLHFGDYKSPSASFNPASARIALFPSVDSATPSVVPNASPSHRRVRESPSRLPSLAPDASQPGGCALMSGPSISYEKDEQFYFSDRNVFFLVDRRLFKVHSFFFERNSAYFRTLLSENRQSSDSNPILLDDVAAVDFQRFLRMLYPTQFDKHSAITKEEWVSVLLLATAWDFTSIRTVAIRELVSCTSPIDKIVLGRKYDISYWLKDAYIAVCTRPEALTVEEAEDLGLKESINISKVRQDIRVGATLVGGQMVGGFVGHHLLKSPGSETAPVINSASRFEPSLVGPPSRNSGSINAINNVFTTSATATSASPAGTGSVGRETFGFAAPGPGFGQLTNKPPEPWSLCSVPNGQNSPPLRDGTSLPLRCFLETDAENPRRTLLYQSISCMPHYRVSSVEELRVQDYAQGRKTAPT
ncbi:hypothetical protein JAAARDRAFT_649751 [Jaapia argillacea MUCL 33604]|uniref:BTB domain-containing protein n=1 Tax=Jaapia argillacea MUCL 33604 TaxID=933084 RepID=A0A067PYN8_9AGAM|nr:hypothetical protein JAAARDRAFT_649751 [Jaapia argillacea MUCL 33604]